MPIHPNQLSNQIVWSIDVEDQPILHESKEVHENKKQEIQDTPRSFVRSAWRGVNVPSDRVGSIDIRLARTLPLVPLTSLP